MVLSMENITKHKLWQRFRDPISGLTHLAGAFLGLIGTLVLLALSWGSWLKFSSFLIYGISLILMFSASASYHLVKADAAIIQRLRKFDHSAIYLLIAGSYTPICLLRFTGFWSWGLLSIIWGMALIGVFVKLFVIKAPRWITAGVYLIMGWLCILAVQEMIRTLPPASLTLLVVGGLFYSIGALIYILKKPNFIPNIFGFHEFWHIFVLCGAFTHFAAVSFLV